MKRKILVTTLLFGLALLATACGSQSGSSVAPISVGDIVAPGTAGAANTPPPNYQFHFSVLGSGIGTQIGGGPMTATTHSALTINIWPGIGMALQGSGYTVGFNCEKFTIKVGSVTRTAFVKKSSYDMSTSPGDPCASAQTAWSGDFSAALVGTGQQTVNIQVLGNTLTDNCYAINPSGWGATNGGCQLNTVNSQFNVDGYIGTVTN